MQVTITSGSGPDGPAGQTTTISDHGGVQGSARFPSSEPAPIPQHSQGLTFKAPSGLPLDPRQAGPDSVVTLPNGEQWTAQALVYAGELVETPEGYRLAAPAGFPASAQQATHESAPQPQAQQQQPQAQAPQQADQQQPAEQPQDAPQDAPEDGALFSPKVEAIIDDLAERVGDTTTAALVNELSSGQEPSASTLAQIASRLGCDPAEASNMVGHVRATYEQAARSAVESVVGADLVDAVLEHAQQTGTLSDAISRLAGGSAQAFSKLAQSYVSSLDVTNPAFILNAELPEGVTVRQADNGTIVVSTPDSQGEVSWPVAVKLGFISIGGR